MARELYDFCVDGMKYQQDVILSIQKSDYHRRTKNWYLIPKDAKLEGL